MEDIKVNFFDSVQTSDKTYNKIMIKGFQPSLNFKKVIAQFEDTETELSEQEMEEEKV